MLDEFENIFYPSGPDQSDYKLNKQILSQLPTGELIKLYNYYKNTLEAHRQNEPHMKRRNKSKYKIWMQMSHNYLDYIRDIAMELENRRKQKLFSMAQ